MARKFLYGIAIIILLVLAAALAYRLFGTQLIRAAMVPSAPFSKPVPTTQNAYADPSMWIARPDIAGNPALFLPEGVAKETTGNAAIFFIHPTSYLNRKAWNAPLGDQEANDRAALFVRGQASVFSAVGDIWAPRYRQATFGAFLTDAPDAKKALAAAYADVAAAFDNFLASVDPKRPIILAGHSQGALHLTQLLREKIANTPLNKRVVAAYIVGWPVSATTDVAALGLPICKTADQSGCLMSWQSFAEPADTALITETYEKTIGFDGKSRKGSPMICTNPLTGGSAVAAPQSSNLGTLKNSTDFKAGTLVKGLVPARCDAQGYLMIGEAPEMGPYVLPGNNYHVYDFSLFWANMRADAAQRLAGFTKR
ncbi:MAG: DUF3089 domain-containing protein [Chakrabartia sp.]